MKKNVLLVEYDTSTIELIQEILSSPVFNMETVDEGDKAKELVKNKNYDLVITAAMLPKFHGFNLSQFIGTQSPQTKILIISGIYKGIEYKHQAITQYKADDFLEKPLNRNQLKKRILELLDLEEENLKGDEQSPTTEIPLTDTTKIPAVQKSEPEKTKYSSNDLFGDIIDEVEKIPIHEIKLDKESDKKAEPRKETKDVSPKSSKKKNREKIDLELANLVKVKSETPDQRKFKKIEDDINKKLEDTLSGLGIKLKTTPKKDIEDKKAKPSQEPAKETPAPKTPVERTDELGDYDILGLIARGGMAEIYKAKKKGVKGFEKVIAIKKILSGYGEDDKYIEMLVDEAKIAAELSHPNIVQIYDLGKKDDYYFIAMEYIQGKDLGLTLKKLNKIDKWIPEEISIYLIIKVLEALGYAHSAKDNQGRNLEIVHRDISPPNIMISFGGDVKLTDFGVSKASIKIHQTISGALKGKLLYMSPEQAKGDKNIDSRSDLFSVGVLLFELITQEKLFLDSSEMEVLKKVQNGSIIKPSEFKNDINTELERIILKSLNKDRDQRYQSAPEMIRDLESYLQNNYDHIPNSIHISRFLYDLFKKEIQKENIKVDLKQIPYEIKRKAKAKIESPPALDTEKPEVKKKDEKAPEEENFVPTIEIDFENPKPIKEHTKPSAPIPEGQPEPLIKKEKKIPSPSFIDFEQEDLKKEKRKKKFKFFFMLLFPILAVAAGYYFLYLSPDSRPVEAISKTQTNSPVNKTAEKTSNPQLIEDPFEVLIPVSGDNDPLTSNQFKVINNKPPETKVPIPSNPVKSEEIIKPESKKKTNTIKPFEQARTQIIKQSPQPQPKNRKSPEKISNLSKDIQPDPITPTPAEPEVKKEAPPPPKKTYSEGSIVTASELDTKPQPVSTPLPRIQKKTRKSLTTNQNLLVTILINHRGNVEKVKLLKKSVSAEINSLIISSIAEWKYKPATKNDFKVKTWKQIPITIKKIKE